MTDEKAGDRGPLVAEPKVTLQRHKSSLPTFLYLLSFCEKVPSPFSSFKSFARHPGVIYFVGFITALLAGLSITTLDLLYGRVWTKDVTSVGATPALIRSTSSRVAWYMAIITVVYLALSWIFLVCFSKAAHKLTVRLRHAYVSSALCQDSAWHDEHGAGEIAAHAGKDVNVIRVAFGEKLAFIVWSSSTLIACLITGFTQIPKIAAVLWTLVPFTLLVFAFLAIATDKVVAPMLRLEGKANSFIEEAFGGVRVTQAFSMRDRLVSRFEHKLIGPVLKLAFRRSALRSAETGLFYFSLTASYSFAFFIIARFRGETGPSLTVFFGCLNGLFAMLNVVPMITNIQDAMSALNHMRSVIEREPLIDIRDKGGLVPDADSPAFQSPAIEFRDVTMAYPSRVNVASLDNVSITIPAGKVTALVGPSGSGKSTITELILRAYDPLTANVPHPVDVAEAKKEKAQEDKKQKSKKSKAADVEAAVGSEKQLDSGLEKSDKLDSASPAQGHGTVLYANHDIRELNLVWLRSQIAVVRQAPQIFSGSIFENTAAGLIGTSLEYRPNTDGSAPTDEQEIKRVALIRERVEVALKKAQAWAFVSRLPEGMDTLVSGGRTGLLSGGQRQRIAIARALVSEPRLLIIDEGTSALDSSTEACIREMLEQEQRQRGMTCILVAHRLSTIQHADQIIVMRAGCVVDSAVTTSAGSANDALMQTGRQDSTFRDMVTTQRALAEVPESEPEQTQEQDREELESVDYKLHRVFSDDAATTAVASARPSSPKARSQSSKAQFTELRRQLSSRQGHSYGVSARGGGGASQIPDYHDVEQGGDADEPGVDRGYLKKFLKIVRDYKWLFLVGIVGALAVGASFPVSGYLVGEVVESLSVPNNSERVRQTNRWSLWFLVMAIVDLILILSTSTALEVASEKLIARLKIGGLRSLLNQEIGFFDSPDSQPGTIAANLASFPQNVGSATGLITSQVLVSLGNFVGSLILGFVLSWKASVVVFSPVVLLFIAGWLNVVMLEKYETQVSGPAGEAAGQLAEAMDAYHEVITLGREQEIMRQMDERSKAQPKRNKYLFLGASGFAVAQAMILGVASIIFVWGGELYARGELDTKQLYAIFEAGIIGCFSASRLLTFTPDIGRAVSGFKSITRWMERKPIIATLIPENGNVPKEGQSFTGEGDIVFSNVEMRYPQRREHPALKALDLVIKNGQTHAFCGVSGGGKSSILQLCARFYDPCQGTIYVGGADVRAIPLEEFRASMSIVSQDPVLLSGTIKENIELGSLTELTQQEIEDACEQACILDFIRGLPNGFDTEIGSKGAQLSGGQKQRICIARAIVRKPRILLLDEATSALDAQSEHSVQRALDRATKGRTTITIAHRLSTIRGADVIHVVEDGKIIESGSHAQLLTAGGRYLELIQAQL